MRKILIAIVASAVWATGGIPQAQAGDDGWAALGGFIGGLIIGSGHHSSYQRTVVYGRPCYEPEPIAYRYERCERWVPAAWVYRSSRCGRSVKVWKPGYYTTYYKKVPRHRSSRRHYSSRRHSRDW